jgi:hypothetical protein
MLRAFSWSRWFRDRSRHRYTNLPRDLFGITFTSDHPGILGHAGCEKQTGANGIVCLCHCIANQ